MEWWDGVVLSPGLDPYTLDGVACIYANAPVREARLAERLALLMQREMHYDFSLFHADRHSDLRAYVVIHQYSAVALAIVRITEHFGIYGMTNEKGYIHFDSLTPTPSIVGIFVCAGWRRQGVAQLLVRHVAKSEGCRPNELAWSLPLSEAGMVLATSFGPKDLLRVSR